mmetsp:Transcript_43023/g.69812  ORF Transcript_43023/g.69812 Transcript_43023/m.69812 type:complete len:346 (-) Transcript_43023:59-1096(-)
MNVPLLILALGSIVSIVPVDCQIAKSASNASKAAERLTEASLKASSHVLRLNGADYEKLILSYPRTFGVFALFTVTKQENLGPGGRCDACLEITPEFTLVAKSYWEAVKRRALNKGSVDEIFFCLLDLPAAESAFTHHKLQNIPRLLYLPPHLKTKAPKSDKPENSFDFKGGLNAESIAKFIDRKTGLKVKIQRSRLPLLLKLLTGIVMVSVIWMNIRKRLQKAPALQREIVCWSAMVFYSLCVGGLMFDIIHQPMPWYIYPQTGQFLLVHPAHGQQFILEGLVAGALCLASCCGVLLIAVVTPRTRSELFRYIYFAIGWFLMMGGFYYSVKLYTVKNRWYLHVS